MPKSPFQAAGSGLPSANIIPMPVRSCPVPLDATDVALAQAARILNLVASYSDMNEDEIDRAIAAMMKAFPDALERMIRETGMVLQNLRDLTAFLAAMDLHLQAAGYRFVEREAL